MAHAKRKRPKKFVSDKRGVARCKMPILGGQIKSDKKLKNFEIDWIADRGSSIITDASRPGTCGVAVGHRHVDITSPLHCYQRPLLSSCNYACYLLDRVFAS